jgi:hypothetical protein
MLRILNLLISFGANNLSLGFYYFFTEMVLVSVYFLFWPFFLRSLF